LGIFQLKVLRFQEESGDQTEIMENIEIKWAAQLAREHKNISWIHGVDLSTPIINISSARKMIGQWSDHTKTLSISRHLIQNEIWDVVLEVLKHEMAHQYVSEFCNDADRHGRCFQKACKILGVHPAFTKCGIDYGKNLLEFKGELPADARKMLEKVRKLMALGQSGNEAEAQSASRKANYLLNKYNLRQISKKEVDSDIKYLTLCHKKKRIESVQRAILSLLKKYYYVDCLTSHLYHAEDDSVYKSIVLVGRKESLKVSEYVYFFLFETAKTLWRDFKKQYGARRGEKVSFDMGFIAGIEHNHKKMFENSAGEVHSDSLLPVQTVKELVKRNQIDNQKEISRLFPKLKKIRYGKHQAGSDAFKEGFKNGRNTHIKRGVTRSGKGVAGLLAG